MSKSPKEETATARVLMCAFATEFDEISGLEYTHDLTPGIKPLVTTLTEAYPRVEFSKSLRALFEENLDVLVNAMSDGDTESFLAAVGQLKRVAAEGYRSLLVNPDELLQVEETLNLLLVESALRFYRELTS